MGPGPESGEARSGLGPNQNSNTKQTIKTKGIFDLDQKLCQVAPGPGLEANREAPQRDNLDNCLGYMLCK